MAQKETDQWGWSVPGIWGKCQRAWGAPDTMANKSAKSRQGQSGGNLKNFRHDVARLKSLGLVRKSVDARSQAPTRYMKSQIKKFGDVLEGRARVVTVPPKIAKEYGDAYTRKERHVIVPAEKTETIFYDKKQERIVATRAGYEPGQRLRREFIKSGEVRQPLPEGYMYVIPLGSGEQRFDTWEDAVLFMTPYETARPSGGAYHGALGDWTKYLIVERTDDADSEDA